MITLSRSDGLASRILSVSGTMIGGCAALIGLVKLAGGSSRVDEYAVLYSYEVI
jgi:hypothetical protein